MQFGKSVWLGTLLGASWTLAVAECNPSLREHGVHIFETKCAICHSADPRQGHQFGPNLGGVVGRPIGKAAGFEFSAPLRAAVGKWDMQALEVFLNAPTVTYPGTLMAFAGLQAPEDRSAVLCFLNSVQ